MIDTRNELRYILLTQLLEKSAALWAADSGGATRRQAAGVGQIPPPNCVGIVTDNMK